MDDSRIITVEKPLLRDAAEEMREKVLDLCNNGWKLQGGASVTEKDYKNLHWCEIYQKIVKGNQKLIDYGILETSGFGESADSLEQRNMLELQRFHDNGWKIQGGVSVTKNVINESDGPCYTIYHTMIKEE